MRSSTAVAARAVVTAAESIGASRDRMLAALGMRWDDLGAYDLRIPHTTSVRLWEEIIAWNPDPLIGLRVARALAGSGQAALFEYTIRAAPTIAEAWTNTSRLLALFFGDGFEAVTREVEAGWEVGYHLPVHGEPPIAASEECLVLSFLEQCRMVAPQFHADAVCFQHAARCAPAEWRRELGCAVEFGASFYGVRMSPRTYRLPIPGHDPSLAGLIETLARPLVATLPAPQGPADPAIRVVRDLLDRGEPVTVDAVARALHVSRRTLQRQLAAANTSVRAEHERARRDAALALLRDPRATVAEIADRLGFADPSQFTRAVRRWTGSAPTELRRKNRA